MRAAPATADDTVMRILAKAHGHPGRCRRASRVREAGTSGGTEPFDSACSSSARSCSRCVMALSARYGFDRDELYFLDCARHLQASYVDQPARRR